MKLWISLVVVLAMQAVWPAPCAWGSADCNVCVADAVGAIASLRRHGDAMGFHMNGTPDVEFDHHWQGVRRLMSGGGRYLAISRSLASESTDVSFVVVEMASVQCTVNDFANNAAACSFSVQVKGAGRAGAGSDRHHQWPPWRG